MAPHLSNSNSDETNGRVDMSKLSSEDRFAVSASWFLGPKAENSQILHNAFAMIAKEIENGRKSYHPEDPPSITNDMIENEHAKRSVKHYTHLLQELSDRLAKHSAPFFSHRYAAHMNSETTLPAMLGYLIGMVYNQNNVAPEGGPLTGLLEYEVGQDLCKMLGFTSRDQTCKPWGHLTAGGSISNLEAVWIARNLKYYPLSLKCAMEPGKPLSFAGSLKIVLCDGTTKAFEDCSLWELLNLMPDEVLNLPSKLFSQFGIPGGTLERILKPYNIQTVGKDWLDRHFALENPPHVLMSSVNHYSWTKSAAITGIGSGNIVQIEVDFNARMSAKHLRKALESHLQLQQPIYAVVVLAGSTEHGSVDPIATVVAIREQFQKKGLSFMIHADAAWGGYFATKVHAPSPMPEYAHTEPVTNPPCSLPLSAYVDQQLHSLRFTDSVTVDPHKSGYIPYPAGAICYRDGRLRYLVTWNSSVLNIGENTDTAVGIYGVAGSKPGSAATAVYLSHKAVGLDSHGYGYLLGSALFTGTQMYMCLTTMTMDHNALIVVPFNMLSSEREHPCNPNKVRKQKEDILRLLSLSNGQLEDEKVTLAQLGSDLMINAFACNFYIDGKPNQDVTESNFLNNVLYRRLSVRSQNGSTNDQPLVLFSSTFRQQSYGSCLTRFKERLQLDTTDMEDLTALANTSMSPFPTSNGLMVGVVDMFRELAEKELQSILQYRYPRWRVYPCIHAFLLQGTDQLHLVYLPNFNIANYKRQIIATGNLSKKAMEVYQSAVRDNPNEPLIIFTANETLEDILERGSFVGDIYCGSPSRFMVDQDYKPVANRVELTDLKILRERRLDRRSLHEEYPRQMPFYLYGTQNEQHVDHILLRAPNVQIPGNQVKLDLELPLSDQRLLDGLGKGLVVIVEDMQEAALQPFDENNLQWLLVANRPFRISVYEELPSSTFGTEDLDTAETFEHCNGGNEEGMDGVQDVNSLGKMGHERRSKRITTGTLTLGPNVWFDDKNINGDIKPANFGGKKEHPIFQMRRDDKWMDAFVYEIENNPGPGTKD